MRSRTSPLFEHLSAVAGGRDGRHCHDRGQDIIRDVITDILEYHLERSGLKSASIAGNSRTDGLGVPRPDSGLIFLAYALRKGE